MMTKYAIQILKIVESSKRPFDSRADLYAAAGNLSHRCIGNGVQQPESFMGGESDPQVSLEGMADRYDRTRRHDHIVCKKCGRLLDVDLGDLTAQLEEKAGISILSYDLKLLYLCEACRKNLNRKECEETET